VHTDGDEHEEQWISVQFWIEYFIIHTKSNIMGGYWYICIFGFIHVYYKIICILNIKAIDYHIFAYLLLFVSE
jgi:hypothetical protein